MDPSLGRHINNYKEGHSTTHKHILCISHPLVSVFCCEKVGKMGPDQKGNRSPVTPRLSFSNNFVESESHRPMPTNKPRSEGTSASDDFEFSAVTDQNDTMSAADELFFKGKLLPTLRDELLLDLDDDDDQVSSSSSFVFPKGLPKWKQFLTLNRSAVDAPRCTPNNGNNDKPIPASFHLIS